MNVLKYCCFYVNDVHLVTMLLPYINRKINENKKFVTIFEKDISESVSKVIERVNIKNIEKNNIIKLGWDKCKNVNKIDVSNKIVIIMGSNIFIEKINNFICNKMDNFSIINCYDIFENEDNISLIVNSHEKIINTKGEIDINDFSQNRQKKMTLKSQ